MASPSPLTDLTENFFLCSVCLDQFKEPKLLPCLHRYCRDCLDKIIQASFDGTFKCPICQKTCEISEDGVNGFKTDFHMKSMLEFIQLQKSSENDDLKECVSCSKKLKMSVYCFKCGEFLCDRCGQFHTNNRLFKDHKQHIIKLGNGQTQQLLLEKLETVTENTRCHHHADKEAQLCCSTCGNLTVCVTCVYDKHRGHDLRDVTGEAEYQKKSLKMRLLDINQHREKLYKLPNMIHQSMKKLKENGRDKSEKIKLQYERQVQRIEDKMEEGKAEREKNRENVKTRRTKELNEIRIKYEEVVRKIERKYDQEFHLADNTYDQMVTELNRKRERLNSNLKELTEEKEKKMKQNDNELQSILEHCQQIIKRYEDFMATFSSILASNDKRADARCITDIKTDSERLLEVMKKEFPQVEYLANFKMNDLINVMVEFVSITEREESAIDVEGIQGTGFDVSSLTDTRNGTMVITGTASVEDSHITAIDRDGKLLRQEVRKHPNCMYPSRYCCKLSEFKVVTVSHPDEIGIYDVRDGSYNSKEVTKTIPNCRMDRCVTTDPVKNHILVGTRGREVHVFDFQLNYVKTIQLPDVASYQLDVSVHDGNLLVCSNLGSAYEVSLEGSISHVLNEFPKPHLDGGNWKPFGVCTDKNGFIYTLWRACTSGENRRILVQYGRDCQQIVTQIQVDNNSISMTTAEQGEAELLVVATRDTRKLYTYVLDPQ